MIYCRQMDPEEHDKWDHFVEGTPQGSIFHISAYKRAIDLAYGTGEYMLVGAFQSDALVGGCAFLERRSAGVLTAVMPLLTPYAGIILAPAAVHCGASSDEIVQAIARWLAGRYSYQSWSCVPGFADGPALGNEGYSHVKRQTFQIDLRRSTEELWDSFSAAARRQVRKAEKANFDLSHAPLPVGTYEIFERTFTKHGEKCPVHPSYFHEYVSGQSLAALRSQIAAFSAGRLLSFITLLSFKKTGYYAVAATDPVELSSGVSSLLVWTALQKLKSEGAETFDFVGANIPSIAKFKTGFGPQLQEYYQVERYSGPHVKLARKLLKYIRR